MTWTTPEDLHAQVLRLWDRGIILESMVTGASLFPRRLQLKTPSSTELVSQFEEVRAWISTLLKGEHYRVVMREFRHRILGANAVPDEVWIDSLDQALRMIGKQREAETFARLVAMTQERLPLVLPLMSRRPILVLTLADRWQLLLEVAAWIQRNPRPQVYLRQIDIPGVHTKFIESHIGVLSEILELVLPEAERNSGGMGVAGFCRRFGFLEKPLRIRFRVLDPALIVLPGGSGDQDITVDQQTFAGLKTNVRQVFMTENEVNFLAFPLVPGRMIIFGAGYGFENLASARWLSECEMYYWGDIDTHGFAILDQLRQLFPAVHSFLMDRETLLHHRSQWVTEPKPERRNLGRLSKEEAALFDDLRDNRLGAQVRLEQERVGFGWVEEALRGMRGDGSEPTGL